MYMDVFLLTAAVVAVGIVAVLFDRFNPTGAFPPRREGG